MISSIAELISDRIGTMPAGERRAAQTLIASYPLIGLKTVAEFSADKQLADIVAKLADRRGKTFLIGGRFTDPLARYMAAHLAIIQPNVFHLAGQESVWRDRLIDMGKRDVLVIFDIRRYQD
ncbi:MAG: RpiR family transcriptional regulator, partial [Mesorhizobium sp.]